MEAVQLSPGHKNYCADLAIKAKVQFSPQMLMMVTRQNMIITSVSPLRCATMRAGPLVSNATTSDMRWSTAWGNETIVCKSIRVVLKLLYLITLIKGWLYTENERVWTWEEIEAEVMISLIICNFLCSRCKRPFLTLDNFLTFNCLSGPRGLLPVQEQKKRNEFCIGTMISNRFSRV